ncbi:MAG TPA: tetratricopeptide repeat protein [Terriglobales bacterium]|nr:tetratricopeptide repeat protein [Terriglobales bacterium]
MLRAGYLWNLLVLALTLAVGAAAQEPGTQAPAKNPPPPRSDTEAIEPQPQATITPSRKAPPANDASNPNESSSRSTIIDISPPIGDAQEHPDSEVPEELSGTTEMHPWNPHRAEKAIEVGDFYFKDRKNYAAAESRYREALLYKPNDAVATFRLAQVLELTDRPSEARQYYQDYLKILPHGPYAADAHKALERLQAQSQNHSQSKDSPKDSSESPR